MTSLFKFSLKPIFDLFVNCGPSFDLFDFNQVPVAIKLMGAHYLYPSRDHVIGSHDSVNVETGPRDMYFGYYAMGFDAIIDV